MQLFVYTGIEFNSHNSKGSLYDKLGTRFTELTLAYDEHQ